MQTQETRASKFALTLIGIPFAKIDGGMLKLIKSRDVGAIVMDATTSEIRILSKEAAKDFQPGQNDICLQSSQKVKDGDEHKLASINVTKQVDTPLTEDQKGTLEMIAWAMKGAYAGRFHDDNYNTENWIAGGDVATQRYNNTFVDSTKGVDKDGKQVLILLGDSNTNPIIQVLDSDGKPREVQITGLFSAMKDMEVLTISRPFPGDDGKHYMSFNADDGSMALAEIQAQPDGKFVINVLHVANADGELKVDVGDTLVYVKALVGPSKDGDTFGILANDGTPYSLDDDGRQELLNQVLNVPTAPNAA